MAKLYCFSVAALLGCVVTANALGYSKLKDEEGNPCPPCIITHELFPVCGCNEETYDNPSLLKCHSRCLKSKIIKVHDGVCNPHLGLMRNTCNITCACAVTFEYLPVCGDDGNTYMNYSVMKCEAECNDTVIHMEHYGKCV